MYLCIRACHIAKSFRIHGYPTHLIINEKKGYIKILNKIIFAILDLCNAFSRLRGTFKNDYFSFNFALGEIFVLKMIFWQYDTPYFVIVCNLNMTDFYTVEKRMRAKKLKEIISSLLMEFNYNIC